MTETLKNASNDDKATPYDILAQMPSFNTDSLPTPTKEEIANLPLEKRFNISPKEYPIFSKQAGNRLNQNTDRYETRTLNINETLGEMVSATACTIVNITGEKSGIPMDHVIYLDKSARPVSWLVDEFWQDFADTPKPSSSFLAIDRRIWFQKMGVELTSNEYVEDPNGDARPASIVDVNKNFDNISRETLARIRALYIPNGIESENPDEIFATPTILDDKNIFIIDEVSRSGSTLHIAKRLLEAAIPGANVYTHVFWHDQGSKTASGETQMGSAPVWYPHDKNDWRGRGVKDINQAFYEKVYLNNPTSINRARHFGSLVLGEPLTNPEEEPGQPSWHLRDEIRQMHQDYEKGRILPNVPPEMPKKLISTMREWGVEFTREPKPHAYISLINERNLPPKD